MPATCVIGMQWGDLLYAGIALQRRNLIETGVDERVEGLAALQTDLQSSEAATGLGKQIERVGQ